MRRFLLPIVGIILLWTTPVRADDAELPSAAELGRLFRALLLPNLPKPLVTQSKNWDHQEMVPIGLKWDTTKHIVPRPEIMKSARNDGLWRKIALTADDPDRFLGLRISDVKLPEAGRMTFAMQLQLPVHVKFEQQLWRSGTRVYSGETRARCQVSLQLKCESISRFETKPNSFFPDMVLRLRVLEANLHYTKFVVEHTAGVGGELAKVLGDAVHETIKGLRPSLEHDLLEKANAAIVKAGDTKEVRLSLSKLFDKK